eukprot:COSAG06_NODE_61859_length_266_cov_1.137725_1_plen_39_part_01
MTGLLHELILRAHLDSLAIDRFVPSLVLQTHMVVICNFL